MYSLKKILIKKYNDTTVAESKIGIYLASSIFMWEVSAASS